MQSQNLSKKSLTNISIFTKHLTDEIFKDFRFVQLMNLLIKSENLDKFTYCFYCDSSMVKTNIFIPVFHTMYMSCRTNNVLIKDHNDLWIKDVFKHNKYYVLKNEEDTFNYDIVGVTKINDIKEIAGVL